MKAKKRKEWEFRSKHIYSANVTEKEKADMIIFLLEDYEKLSLIFLI